MKKIILLILSFALIFGIFPQDLVYGEEDLEKNLKDITIKMKDMFSIEEEYENFDTRINTSNEKVFYYLNWSDESKIIPNINLEVDEDGNVYYYNKNYRDEEVQRVKSIGKSKAMEIALNFIKKVAPEKLNEIEEIKEHRNNPRDNMYTIRFYRIVNDISYYNNTVEIGIDKNREEVISYYTNWDYDVKFPDKDKAIEIDKAKNILKREFPLELIYKVKHNMGIYAGVEEPEFYLVYDFLYRNKAVDAITGEVIEVDRNIPLNGYGGMEDAASEESLSPEELEEIENLSGIKDIEEIENIARDILKIDEEYKLERNSLNSSWKNKGEYIWNLYFKKEIVEKEEDTISIDLNGKTGELISFYKYRDLKDKKTIINEEEALKLAKEFIEKNTPEKLGKIEYMPRQIEGKVDIFDFRFIRKQDNIYIEEDNIYVSVDARDKTILSYSDNWYKEEIPPKGEIISKDRAYEILFKDIGYKLMYTKIWKNGEESIKLVYDTPRDKPVNIDAKTGKLLDRTGDEYIPLEDIEYTDLDNSYAKDKINALGEYGIGFKDEKFRPKDKILQKDFLNLIWQYNNPYRKNTEDVEKMYKDLISTGIVKEGEKSPDEIITKEQGVVFIIRAMNYEEVASLKEIYGDIFTDSEDINPKFIGHVNIGYGLKIIEGDGNSPPKLTPKYELNREDGANIIYNYIFR